MHLGYAGYTSRMDELELSGRRHLSAKRAAREHRYHSDYIGQLIRSGKVAGQKVGRSWYVDADSLAAYLSGEVKPAAPSPQPEEVAPAPAPEPAVAIVENDVQEEVVTAAVVDEPLEQTVAAPENREEPADEVQQIKINKVSEPTPTEPEPVLIETPHVTIPQPSGLRFVPDADLSVPHMPVMMRDHLAGPIVAEEEYAPVPEGQPAGHSRRGLRRALLATVAVGVLGTVVAGAGASVFATYQVTVAGGESSAAILFALPE